MNGIDKITGRIESDAQTKIKTLLLTAKQEAAEIAARIKAESDAECASIIAEGKKLAEQKSSLLKSAAALEAKKALLAEKQRLLDEAFEIALKKICSLPQDEYVSLLSRLAAKSSSTGDEELILSDKDKSSIGTLVVSSANDILKASGKNANLTLSDETRSFCGGLYMKSGPIEYNCSFEDIICSLRESMAGEVSALLFA